MTSSDETNEYSVFETSAEIMAYVYSRHGADELRKLLRMPFKNATREGLEDDAAELQQVGLAKAAAIVREAAQKALPETDMRFCPYMAEPYISSKSNQYNIDAWLGSVKAQRQRKRAKKLLAAAGSPAA